MSFRDAVVSEGPIGYSLLAFERSYGSLQSLYVKQRHSKRIHKRATGFTQGSVAQAQRIRTATKVYH